MQNRIKELRLKYNLTLKELSQQLKNIGFNISPDSLAKYERGDRNPKIEKWQEIAFFFGVSVSYLQGYEEITPNDLKFDSKQDAIDCIKKIMKALDINKEDLEKNIDDEGDKDAKR